MMVTVLIAKMMQSELDLMDPDVIEKLIQETFDFTVKKVKGLSDEHKVWSCKTWLTFVESVAFSYVSIDVEKPGTG
jgi:hypothetical protein